MARCADALLERTALRPVAADAEADIEALFEQRLDRRDQVEKALLGSQTPGGACAACQCRPGRAPATILIRVDTAPSAEVFADTPVPRLRVQGGRHGDDVLVSANHPSIECEVEPCA